MAVDQTGSPKPFGPIQTPSIFAEKWYSKFSTHIDNVQARLSLTPYKEMTYVMCDTCELMFEHLVHFYAQAAELDVTNQKFLNDGSVNPFPQGEQALFMVEDLMQHFRARKYGERKSEGSWQELPVQIRRRINDLLVKVEKAKEDGFWVVTDAARAIFEGEKIRWMMMSDK